MQSTVWRWLRRLPLALALRAIDLYGLAMLAFAALRVTVGERWPLIALSNTGAHVLFAASIALGLVRAASTDRRWALLHALPTALFLWHYAPNIYNLFRPPTAAPPALTVLSYNAAGGRDRIEGIHEVARTSGADVVLLQDVLWTAIDEISEAMAADYPYHASFDLRRRDLLTLSRLPFVGEPAGAEESRHLRTVVEVEGRQVALYNVHLTSPSITSQTLIYNFDLRRRELNALLDVTSAEAVPVILGGDFNSSDWSEPYAQMAARYRDSFQEAGTGLGLTRVVTRRFGGIGFVRIDFLFHSPELDALAFQTHSNSYGSDHIPIYARFAFAPVMAASAGGG